MPIPLFTARAACRTAAFVGVPVWLVAVGLTAGTGALLGVPVAPGFYAAVLAGAAFVYLADRMLPAPEDAANHPARTRWVHRHRAALAALGGVWVTMGVGAALSLRLATVVGGAAAGVGAALYTFPLVGGRRLKTVALLKIVLIAGAWGVATVVLPLVESRHLVDVAALALVGARMLTVAANVLVHDWLDRGGDAASGVATLVQGWTWPRVQRAAWVLLGGAALLLATLLPHAGWLALVDAAGLLVFALVLCRPPRNPVCYGALVDLLVAWPLVTALIAGGMR